MEPEPSKQDPSKQDLSKQEPPTQGALPPSLRAIADLIHQETQTVAEDSASLLALLRLLEQLHREIRDEYFLKILPTNRQALYALLRDIEQNGGWPYIPRFKLQKILREFEEKSSST